MKIITIQTPPDGNLWQQLERLAAQGLSAMLTADQIRLLISDNAFLIEAKNELVREQHKELV